MGYIYAYNEKGEDTAGVGLVGALWAYDATFEQDAGEFGELTFSHPIDPWGKWRALVDGAVLKADVPCRLPVEFTASESETAGDFDIGLNVVRVESVDIYKVKKTATRYERFIYYAKKSEDDPTTGDGSDKRTKHKLLLKPGRQVTVLQDTNPGDDNYRYKVRVTSGKKKVTGYMEKSGLEVVQQHVTPSDASAASQYASGERDWLEDDQPSWAVQPQLFRIYSVETTSASNDAGTITVRARRLVYDLLGNVCGYRALTAVSCRTAAQTILSETYSLYRHPFTVESDIGDKHVGIDARNRNQIEALIDPDDGVAARWGGEVYCDDYDLYIVRHAGQDRGVRIEYGKDLAGIQCAVDSSETCTAIRPVGEKANGEPLLLDGHAFIDPLDREAGLQYGYNYSADRPGRPCANVLPEGYMIAWDGPVEEQDGRRLPSTICRKGDVGGRPRCMVLEVSDAKVTKTDKNTDPSEQAVITLPNARIRLAEAAVAAFEAGCDIPEISMQVDFTQLGNTEEYKQYRGLEPLFLYDTVRIVHKRLGITASVQVTGIRWDVCNERMIEASFGSLGDARVSIPSYSIKSVNGAKLVPGSVNSGQLADNAVSFEHLQVDSVNAQIIQSDSILSRHIASAQVTTDKLAAGAITADKLDANAVSTKLLTAMNAVIQELDAGHAEVETLEAAMATIQVLEAGSATFDAATVQHLVAEAMNLTFGTAGDVFIDNLRVAYAQMVSATIGNLCVKASDGNYYTIDVSQAGLVTATLTSVTPEEESAGQTTGGRTILDTDITATNLSTANLLATYALVNQLDAARIDVDQLTARQAFIDALNTNVIQGNEFIELSIANATDDLNALLRVESDGLHVKGYTLDAGGDPQPNGSEVHIDGEGMNINMNGTNYSQFKADYVQFGNYQLRRTADGGLAFKLRR